MALQWFDPGGEYYFSLGVSGALSAGIISDQTGMSLVSNAAAGRATTYAYSSTGSGVFLGKFLGNFQETILGWASYTSSGTWVNANRICTFNDATTTQVDVCTDSSGHLFVRRGGSTTIGTSTNILTTGWHYFEVKAKIAGGTSGSCEIRVDGVVWLTITGANTQQTGNAFANRFYFLPVVPNTQQYYKDLVILDTGTGVRTSYLGDITVACLFVNGADGTFQQWAANTGTQPDAVDDGITHSGTWPDGDTTYIFDSTSGDISAFAHQTLAATGSIYGMGHASYCRKDDVGSRSMNQVLVQSGSVVETSSTIALGNSYLYFLDIIERNPTGSVDWTVTSVNGTNGGVKIT